MKRVIAFLGLAGLFLRGRAQTFAEWFEQKKTQIRYLKEQIAALGAYDRVVQDGYGIAFDGLGSIAQSKQEDLGLHTGYFASLTTVKPGIKDDPRVRETSDLAAVIGDIAEQVRAAGAKRPALTEMTDNIYEDLMDGCVTDLRWLKLTLEDGEVEEKDEDRMRRVIKIYEGMKKRYFGAIGIWNAIYSLPLIR